MSSHTSNKAVITALVGNTLISIIKYIVAFITGSAGMLAESVHSTADCFNQIFLLIGVKRSKKDKDEEHSIGYGREEFFWGLLVALFLFFVGACFSIYEGIHKLNNPEKIDHVWLSLVVLIISIIIEFTSFNVAYKEFRKTTKGSFINGLKKSVAVNLIVILLEDFAALSGLVLVFITTCLSIYIPIFDAIGSILVGILLLLVAIFMTDELRKLIVGESMSREKCQKIKEIARSYNKVNHINKIQTMSMGRSQYMVLLSIDFEDDMSVYDTEDIIEQIKIDVKSELPEIDTFYIEAKDANRNNKI
ncbi:cation diffusion facilitator family transporter [bacterium]|jgi:cation diffusion facilitator family transporter|nr:cation diffusion facilitator family transporter [bacterium]